MKKIMISNLFVFLMFSIVACSGNNATSISSDKSPLNSDEAIMESEDSSVEKLVERKSDDSSSTQYLIGDIILADGSAVKETEFTVIDGRNIPIAVIAGFKEDGTAFGVGVHRSDTPLQWAVDDTIGYADRFIDIVCTQDFELDFSGDKDGSDNWDVICSQDEEGSVDAVKNYPAFHFVNKYAQTYDLTGDYASGWYMPSIAELSCIYQNREEINTSLQKIYGLDNNAAMNGLDTNWYWSSSQADLEDDYAWFMHYFNGYAGECPKNFTNVHVLAVRGF